MTWVTQGSCKLYNMAVPIFRSPEWILDCRNEHGWTYMLVVCVTLTLYIVPTRTWHELTLWGWIILKFPSTGGGRWVRWHKILFIFVETFNIKKTRNRQTRCIDGQNWLICSFVTPWRRDPVTPWPRVLFIFNYFNLIFFLNETTSCMWHTKDKRDEIKCENVKSKIWW